MSNAVSSQVQRATTVLEAVAHDDIEALADAYPEETRLRLSFEAIADEDDALADDLRKRPAQTLDAFDEALQTYDAGGVAELSLARATVEIVEVPDEHTYTVGGFSPSEYINNLLAIEGQVTKRTSVQPKLKEATFRCNYCGTQDQVGQPPFGTREYPDRCPNDECPSQSGQYPASFELDYNRSLWHDYQKVRVQQPPEDAHGESETFDFHVHGPLAGIEAIEGGSRITLTGRYIPVEQDGLVNYDQTMVANSVVAEGDTTNSIEIKPYLDDIRAIAADNPRETLAEAFAPGLAGYDLIKRALVLQLFGGWAATAPDGNYHRGDSHVFLVGDPGVGKTVALRAAYEASPRAALTDGTGSSGVGLTASVTKDDFSDGQWSIEAGTLVRADGGVACIDELDKGSDGDLDELHTALESQQVHVSKAGKNATLPARTAVLAAGNPTGGHFDPTEDFAAQVDLQSPLLSRFDLIFTMRERYREDKIRTVADHIVEGRDAAKRLVHDEDLDEELASLVEPEIEQEVLQAYIAHAEQYEPTATQAAKERMKEWYTEMKVTLPDRYSELGDDATTQDYDGPPLPVTARKLDACFRLAEASARMRLSETVTVDDVAYVTPFIQRSLADIGIAPSGNEAFDGVSQDIDPAEVGI